MEACHYEAVGSISGKSDDATISRKYLLRQILVCSGIWCSYFSFGLSFGSPTVLIPRIRREANSTDAVSVEMASWLSCTLNYSGLVSAVILAISARLVGRKSSFVFICVTSLIANILLYCSTTLTHILISEVMQGPLTASTSTISIMVLTEYVTPRYRGVFLTLKSATFLWGVWVANSIGTFMHWKNITILALVCSVYCALTVLLWPESPYWLANKNKFEDCVDAHRWLKGRSRESETELQQLIQSRRGPHSDQVRPPAFHKRVVTIFISKSLYKPILLSFSVLSLYQFSGKIACAMYAIEIIKRVTGAESTAYTGMLILDGVTVLGMYVGCGLSRVLSRRTLLLVSSALGAVFLFGISFYLYLIHVKIILEHTVISILLLMGYSLAISVGPMIMATTILGELIPVKYRSVSVLIVGCFGNFLMGSILKISPFVLNYSGAQGLFLLFAVLESMFTVINYKVLPETKDKTILEIQDSLSNEK